MNVLFLTHNFPRYAGDHAGAFVLRLARALRDRGVTVNVVAPVSRNGKSEDSIDGIPVERFRYAPRRLEHLAYTGNMAADVGRSWSAKFALVGFLGGEFAAAVRARRRHAPDIIHAHWWFPAGVVGTWTCALAGLPLVTTLHGSDVRLGRRLTFARPMFRHVMKHSTEVTAVSAWLSDQTSELVPGVRPTVAPMPVSTELFAPGDDPREGLLFVGRLSQQKGLAHLLHAMSKMRQKPALQVVGDGPLASELRMLADRLGVADRVTWNGAVRQPELARFYRRARALVVPSTGEGLGMVGVEASLCETPVVAFASGGLSDVVRDGSTGVLVKEADDTELAAALDRVLDDRARAEQLGKAARLHALSAFAPESVAQKYVAVYKRALERGAA